MSNDEEIEYLKSKCTLLEKLYQDKIEEITLLSRLEQEQRSRRVWYQEEHARTLKEIAQLKNSMNNMVYSNRICVDCKEKVCIQLTKDTKGDGYIGKIEKCPPCSGLMRKEEK